MKFEWEKIDETETFATLRAKVIGGWIVKNEASFFTASDCSHNGHSIAVRPSMDSMIFIPDPEHKWEITNE